MAQAKVRKGKRKWYPIHAPKLFENQPLGETYVYEPEQLAGKHLTVNLMTLIGNPKRQNMNVFFRVSGVAEGKAQTETTGMEMQLSSIKRLVRRGRTKVADSFIARTKGRHLVRVKPIIMTRTRADFSVQHALRARSRELLRTFIAEHNFGTALSEIVNMRLQKHLKDQLSTIYPVRSVDIRWFAYEEPGPADDEGDVVDVAYAQPEPKQRKRAEDDGLATMEALKAEVEQALADDEDQEEE